MSYFKTRNFLFITVSVMIVFVASLNIESALGQGVGEGYNRIAVLQSDLEAEVIARTDGDAVLQVQINTIELTQGPQGDTGATGATGPAGADGLSIQGPQGEPGTSRWTDGFETVSTTGSVQIGNDTAACTDGTDGNAGTIRFNNGTFEGCDGTAWISLSGAGSGPGPGPGPGPFACGVDQVQDADGNWYNTVQIDSQCWMAENLKVGNMVSATSNQTNNTEIEKYCYDNQPALCEIEGGLYQWDEMMQYSTIEGVQGICPPTMHIPTDEEWKTLEMALGMTQIEAESTSWRGTDQGDQLKLAASCFGGANCSSSGFQAMLAGRVNDSGIYQYIGLKAYFWTATWSESDLAPVMRYLSVDEVGVFRSTKSNNMAYSVRCVKN